MTKDEKPAFGRSYQTPFADKIRHLVAEPAGAKVIAVGAISSYDDVNSILLAGRADLCALARTHLYDPNWTLHAAAEQDYRGTGASWPVQWEAGRRKPPSVPDGQDPAPPLPAAGGFGAGRAPALDAGPWLTGRSLTSAPWWSGSTRMLPGSTTTAPWLGSSKPPKHG